MSRDDAPNIREIPNTETCLCCENRIYSYNLETYFCRKYKFYLTNPEEYVCDSFIHDDCN